MGQDEGKVRVPAVVRGCGGGEAAGVRGQLDRDETRSGVGRRVVSGGGETTSTRCRSAVRVGGVGGGRGFSTPLGSAGGFWLVSFVSPSSD
jgi:hypothetical protein